MNQETLKAYLNLIQGLLTCPRGEEWILLRDNEKLVNHELVAVMEEVANHLTREGKVKEAKYLHNWAGQLHHILTESITTPIKKEDKTSSYIELIQALLSSPETSHPEILAAHQDLIGPRLFKVMKQIANQIAIEGDQETADFLHNLATELSHKWKQEHEFEPTVKQEVFPDPWLSTDSEAESTSSAIPPTPEPTPVTTANQVEEPVSELETETEEAEEQIESTTIETHQQLQAIADALMKLEAIITSRIQPVNPLWYMEILEKAAANNWLLTTEEVEDLIGIKPQCHHDETSYQRGSWLFVKQGKIGTQTSWQVQKQISSP
jgi:hypothetical protein